MRAPSTDLPIVLDQASLVAGPVRILEPLALELTAGAPTLVLGPNGAGKTTLLRLVMGLVAPSGGRVTWGGRAAVPPLRRAMVLQRPTMLRRSAAGNIRYALATSGIARRVRKGRTAALLALVGLSELGRRPARRLSGGEQQRLALARALAREPEVLLLDEPTAGLDPAGAKAIEDLIAGVAARGIKVVMATHDLGAARRLAGDVVLLHRGRLIEQATAAAFFAAPATEAARRFLAGDLLL